MVSISPNPSFQLSFVNQLSTTKTNEHDTILPDAQLKRMQEFMKHVIISQDADTIISDSEQRSPQEKQRKQDLRVLVSKYRQDT